MAWMAGTVAVFATANEVGKEPAEPALIIGREAAISTQSIQGWGQGARPRGHFELYDHEKGEMVTLRLDEIVLNDPERVVFDVARGPAPDASAGRLRPERRRPDPVCLDRGFGRQMVPRGGTRRIAAPPPGQSFASAFVLVASGLPRERPTASRETRARIFFPRPTKECGRQGRVRNAR